MMAFFLAAPLAGGILRAQPGFTGEQIDKAIQEAVQWCLENQQPDGGWWGDASYAATDYRHGNDVYGFMVLAYGDGDPSDARFQKALKLVLAANLDSTQVHVARVTSLLRLYPRLEGKQQGLVEKRLKADVKWLIDTQRAEGNWNFLGKGVPNRYRDLPNTQKAIYAIHEASKFLRAQPRRELWQRTMNHYFQLQREDGGWSTGAYGKDTGTSNGPTTAGAVTSLLIIQERLFGAPGCPCGRKGRSRRKDLDINKAIERGLLWLNKNFTPKGRAEWGYTAELWPLCVQRVATATGTRYFGSHDWSAEMVPPLRPKIMGWLRYEAQGKRPHMHFAAEAVVCLVEAREQRQPLVNKLRFQGQWNNHPYDMRNLTNWLSEQKKEPLGWQVIQSDLPLEAWQESPILYISAETPIEPPKDMPAKQKEEFKKELHRKLREYTNTGGTILFEASCGQSTVARWWENVCEKTWPEWSLKTLDGRKDPLWSAEVKMRRRPSLIGIDDGLRTFVFFSRADLSCPWNTNDLTKGKPTFELGRNLYAYSTDRASLADWRAQRAAGVGKKYAEQTLVAGEKKKLTVARIKHGKQWNYGVNYRPWAVLSGDLQERAGLEIKEAEPVAPGQAVPQEIDFLYLTGRADCDLGEGGPQWLKEYLSKGGFLLAEATCGDPAFDESFKGLMVAAGLTLTKSQTAGQAQAAEADQPLEADAPVFTGKLFDATGYSLEQVAYTSALQSERAKAKSSKPGPPLYGVYDGRKLVGLYSPYDIMFSQTGYKAFGILGYTAADARALATNIALLMSIK